MHFILQAGRAEGPSDHVRRLAGHLLHCMPYTCETGMCLMADVHASFLLFQEQKWWMFMFVCCLCVLFSPFEICSFIFVLCLSLRMSLVAVWISSWIVVSRQRERKWRPWKMSTSSSFRTCCRFMLPPSSLAKQFATR